MHKLLQRASAALVANDADTLEQLCNQVAQQQAPVAEEAAQYAVALLAFQKQVNSARQNIILRQRLLERRLGQEAPWAP